MVTSPNCSTINDPSYNPFYYLQGGYGTRLFVEECVCVYVCTHYYVDRYRWETNTDRNVVYVFLKEDSGIKRGCYVSEIKGVVL